MVDVEYIKMMLGPDSNERKIQPGDFIPYDVVEILAHGKVDPFKRCFAPALNGDKYTIELKCFCCGKIYTDSGSKTKILKVIRYKPEKKVCPVCEAKKKEQALQQQIKAREEYIANSEMRAEQFIKDYLQPGYDFDNKKDDMFYMLKNKIFFLNADLVAEAINDMDYQDFLNTPYWRTIARHVRKRAKYKCQLCNSGGELHVHHKTYENHGYELQRCETDLICLCSDCHEKFHE